MNGHGGKRQGAGRKTIEDENKLLAKLSPLEDVAFNKLKKGVESGDYNFVKLFFEYRFGKPKQTIEANLAGELSITWNEQKTYETK